LCGLTCKQLEARSAFDLNCIPLIVDKIDSDAATKAHAIGQLWWRQLISINGHGAVALVVPNEVPICCGIWQNHMLAQKLTSVLADKKRGVRPVPKE
jgi:hypothetical protein